MRNKITSLCLCALPFILLASGAEAYVGPGPGLTMLGSFFTLVGGIILAFLMILAYPLRLLYKRVRRGKTTPPDA